MKYDFETMFKEITPPLYDLESMFWIVVAKDLVEKYGVQGEKASRAWIRRHANWRGMQIRKGNQALGVPINVENLFAYTDNPVNNAFIHLWKKDFNWTPWNLKLKVSPGECVMCDRMKQHDIGFLGDVFCDELHQSFTTTYHPDAVVSVNRTMTKNDDYCFFQWVLPGDAEEPEPFELYPGENPLADWKYDTEEDIVKLGIKRMMRWYGAQIYYLGEVLREYFPEKAEEEFERLLGLWEIARAECIKERKGNLVIDADPKTIFENLDMPYHTSWETEIRDIERGIEVIVAYCPLQETWNWIGEQASSAVYCEHCYTNMFKSLNPKCNCEVTACRAKGADCCKIKITV